MPLLLLIHTGVPTHPRHLAQPCDTVWRVYQCGCDGARGLRTIPAGYLWHLAHEWHRLGAPDWHTHVAAAILRVHEAHGAPEPRQLVGTAHGLVEASNAVHCRALQSRLLSVLSCNGPAPPAGQEVPSCAGQQITCVQSSHLKLRLELQAASVWHSQVAAAVVAAVCSMHSRLQVMN